MRSRNHVSDPVRSKALSWTGASLALTGATAATMAAGVSATPAGSAKLPGPAPPRPGPGAATAAPVQRVHLVRAVGLDHMGGDLKRSVPVTRRSSRSRAAQGQSWAGVALIIPQQAVSVSASAA
ncbi:MAG TPA: hypothetical protein VMU94_07750 [Streptosporangiaceae bacterium]|nr:hypothetical protein [Streptosporangiaceae bacterium]